MRKQAISSPTTLGVGALCLLLCMGGAWAFLRSSEPKPTSKTGLPEDLTAEAMRKQAKEDPGALFAKGREVREREDLTEEQRREAGRNMWRAMMGVMDERVDEYYTAAPEQQNEVLDRHIDEWTERMKEWEKRREEWRRGERDDERTDEEREQERRERARRWMGANREERKARSESRDPDAMARRMGYFMAMRKRATERGIDLPGPGGPRGREGGRGGDRRGGRGGEGRGRGRP